MATTRTSDRGMGFTCEPKWLVGTKTVVLLWLLELAPSEVTRIIAVLGVVVALGNLMVEWCGFANVLPGVGWLVGTTMLVLIAQTLILIGLPTEVAHALVLLGFLALLIRRKLLAPKGMIRIHHSESLQFVFVGTLATVTLRNPWMLPYAVCCLIGWKISKNAESRHVRTLLAAGTPILGAAVTVPLRPDNWFLQINTDWPLFEALSWSIARFGVFEHPGNVGGSVGLYHWFAYGLSGSISMTGGLEPWEAALKFMPTAMTAATASVIWSLYRQMCNHDQPLDIPAFGFSLAALLVLHSPLVDSYYFSLIVALVYILIARESSLHKHLLSKSLMLYAIVSLALLLSKVTTALVTACLLVVVALIDYFKGRSYSWLAALVCVVLTIAGYVSAVVTTASATRISFLNSTFMPKPPRSGFVLEFARHLMGSPWLLLPIIALAMAVLAAYGLEESQARQDALFLGGVVTTVGALAFSLFYPDRSLSGYLGLPLLQIFGLYSIVMLDTKWPRRERRALDVKGLLWLFILGGVSALILALREFTWWINNEVVVLEEVFPKTLLVFALTPFPLMILGTSVFLVLMFRRPRENSRARFLTATLLTLAGFLIGHTLYQYIERLRLDESHYTSPIEASYPSSDLIAIGEFVRNNTPSDVVLASNNFCCFGISWWSDIESRYKEEMGGANYMLPAVTQRRFLAQGLRFQGGTLAKEELLERVTLSLRFANEPNTAVFNALRNQGVRGFVVNQALTSHRNWDAFATERFRAGNYVYLSLDMENN